MHKKQLMDPVVGPPKCLVCSRGNTPDDPDRMEDFWVLDLERDVNWGDPVYMCKYCCQKIGAEAGMVDAEAIDELRSIIKDKNRELHNIQAENDAAQRRLRSIVHGKKAVRSARKQVA